MTTGIYLLQFNNTDKVYIGQSLNIESRFTGHLWKLKRGEGAKKLQDAYNTYGIPTITILTVCIESLLNTTEIAFIKEFDSFNKGFNGGPGGDGGPYMEGMYNSNSLYTEEELFNVLYLLSEPVYSIKEIIELTGVSKRAIENIASLKSHRWLKESYPSLYLKLEELKILNRSSVNISTTRTNRIVSPLGEVHIVINVRDFSATNGLLESSVSCVLRGTRPTHKGWHLETYTAPPEFYPEVVSPTGEVYKIKFKEAASFAREHNLDPGALRHVIYGDAKSHKGWKLQTCSLLPNDV